MGNCNTCNEPIRVTEGDEFFMCEGCFEDSLTGEDLVIEQKKSGQDGQNTNNGGKMKKINLNDFAKEIAMREGGKKSISIGQIKEVVKIISILKAEDSLQGVNIHNSLLANGLKILKRRKLSKK